jgi:uncharacterized protein (TIGR03435 family)
MFGQNEPSQTAFDVASIRPTPRDRISYYGDFGCNNGRFVSRGFPVSFVITWSYGISDGRILGLPDWAGDHESGYDIEAKSAAPVSSERCRLMGQALLADRFNMRHHTEVRMTAAYTLLLADGGKKLAKVAETAKRATIQGQTVDLPDQPGLTMSRLAYILGAHPAVGLPVIDKTGLTDRYVFHLNFATREGEDDNRPSVFHAVKDQLGLELRSAKLPIEFLVIDHIEKASEN